MPNFKLFLVLFKGGRFDWSDRLILLAKTGKGVIEREFLYEANFKE